MNKNYLVVHTLTNAVAIIFKDKISGIIKREDGAVDILLESGSLFTFIDKYEDIIRQILQ